MTPRQNVVLAALSAAGRDEAFHPVQVQKLFFLVDREAAGFIGGEQFNFRPYDFGPFDRAVYDELEALERLGMVSINRHGRYKTYRLTPRGRELGGLHLRRMPDAGKDYLERASQWVLGLGFQEIVSAIYRSYPEMRANSVFQ